MAGLDTNDNGVLDTGEITSTTYVCNGPGSVIIQSITANPAVIRPGQGTTLIVSANDGVGSSLTYTWSSGSGDFSSANSATTMYTPPSSVGSYLTSVQVSNGASSVVGYASVLVSASPAGPIITSVSPSQAFYGTEITITGAGFGSSQGTGTVSIGGVNAANITSWGEYQITAIVPVGAAIDWATVIVNVGGADSSPGSVRIYAPWIVVTDSVKPYDDQSIAFGIVNVNDTVTQTVTIANGGNMYLSIGKLGNLYPLISPFKISADACSSKSLAPAASCDVQIQFAPTVSGVYAESFDIPSDDASSSVMISLSGSTDTAPAISLSLNPVAFGTVTTGAFMDQAVSIGNAGTADLVIGTIASSDTLTAPFSIISDGCSGHTVAAGDTRGCIVDVRFSPAADGSYADTFNVPSNDPLASDLTVTVSGTGAPAPPPPPPPGTVYGAITLPFSATGKCYAVVISTAAMSGIAGTVTGVVDGASISYSIANIPPGQYYLYAGVDNDQSSATPPTCAFANNAPTHGDYIGFYGSSGFLPPGIPNVTVSPGGNVYDFTLTTY